MARGKRAYYERHKERLLTEDKRPERREQRRLAAQRRYRADPEAARRRYAAYFERNPHKRQEYAERRRGTRAEEYRRRDLAAHFGLTPEEYDLMLAARGGLCDICRGAETGRRAGKPIRMAVDHRHDRQLGDRDFIRGLLCRRCNTNLGFLENQRWRALAEAYLAGPRPQIPPPLAGADRAGARWRRFRLTDGQFHRMASARQGLCDICQQPEKATHTGRPRNLAVDHDPKLQRGAPGHVRGLLCGVCNTRIWMFDDPEWLRRAEAYVTSPPGTLIDRDDPLAA